ncbi:ARM REPEAT PROTEIN INTERACTING WITH ABF2 [Magnolia sinica]|uniref:ARM REPEAT PROTEIN INTERACTING WITH ABF2 n=1 Tax=Magnolia sinica TaxID=86752 RepID=UPI00265937FC|nr:ARM REPEAT PROTEIN INTERACTING WITH ABF2 [Magnolia sinica]
MAMVVREEKNIEEELNYSILLSERTRKAAEESESFKQECSEVGKRVERLSQMLRNVACLSTSSSTTSSTSSSSSLSSSIYDRPIRRIVSEAVKNLERALTLVRKCRHSGVLRRVVTITSTTDFRKALNLLDASLGDMRWLLSVFDSEDGGGCSIVLSLPPIASIDPILSWVWSYVAVIQMGSTLPDRIEAANALASLAQDNDRNKKIIIEEGGIPPLLKLLKESASPDAQVAAATALTNLATDCERVRQIAVALAIPIVVHVLSESPARVQIQVASLMARMADQDPASREEFARENAIRPLVSLLSIDLVLEDPKNAAATASKQPTSIHSLVQINKEMAMAARLHNHHSNSLHSSEGSSRGRDHHRRDREQENPEVKLELKITCAEALWMLAKGSVSNSRRITETKGLLCLAKIIEMEHGKLRFNCLMTVMEIAAVAESNADLRRAAFKTNSIPAKAVVDQLLRVIHEVGSSPAMQIAAIKSIGSLARTFPARETRVIRPLVQQLSNIDAEVAMEAAVALGKFSSPENFLCGEHSKAIIEFDGVPPLMRLLRSNEKVKVHALILLCYLALHVGNSKELEHARALTALELAGRSSSVQHPSLKELLPKAIYHLELYQAGAHPNRESYAT